MTVRRQRRAGVVPFVVAALLASTLAVFATIGPAAAVDPPTFVTKWGSHGSTTAKFDVANGIAIDSSGNVYVVDTGNDRVQKFTAAGVFITKWGTNGEGNGEFLRPQGVAVDGDDNVYVTDSDNGRVQKFTSGGAYLTQWGTFGQGDGEFSDPRGIAVDSDDNVYVADSDNDRVQKFTSTGTYLTQWGSHGAGNAHFNEPSGIAVDDAGRVFVVDAGNDRVQKFTSSGSFLTTWGSQGFSNGRFYSPDSVAVTDDGTVYVTDPGSSRVQAFTSTGTYLTKWGTMGSANGQFQIPVGIAVTGGDVYVSDSDLDRVQVFREPAPHPQPDERVKLGASGTYKGDNVYNTTGGGQTVTGRAPNGSSVTYYVSVQNDGPESEEIRLKGSGSSTTYSIRYSVGSNPVTSAVTSGSYRTPTLAPGASVTVKVVVTVGRNAPPPSTWTASLTAKSNTDTSRRDTVKFFTMNRPT